MYVCVCEILTSFDWTNQSFLFRINDKIEKVSIIIKYFIVNIGFDNIELKKTRKKMFIKLYLLIDSTYMISIGIFCFKLIIKNWNCIFNLIFFHPLTMCSNVFHFFFVNNFGQK